MGGIEFRTWLAILLRRTVSGYSGRWKVILVALLICISGLYCLPTVTLGAPQDMTSEQLARELERGFQTGQPGQILQLFDFFPDKATPEAQFKLRRQAHDFFQLFFDTFGPTKALYKGVPSQEKFQLSRVYAVYSDVLDQVECDFAYHNYLATLKSGLGAVWINAGVCRTPENSGQRLWIKDLAISLVAPDETFREKAAAFKEQYKAQIATLQKEYSRKVFENRQLRAEDAVGAETMPVKDKPVTQKPGKRPRHKIPSRSPTQGTGLQGSRPTGSDLPLAGKQFPVTATPTGPVNFLFLLPMLSGAVIAFAMAVCLFFYLFYCLCLYVIARKLSVPLAWLAWVPVAQIHPQVLAAGLPGWWTAVIIGAMALSVLPFVGFLLGLALLVVFIYLWMRISERVGVNQWLGLLILLPLVQIIYPVWLAFKNDDHRASVPIRSILTRTLLVFLLLTALCWGLATFVISPFLAPLIGMAGAIQEPGRQINQVLQTPDIRKEKAGPAFQNLGREDYERLLATVRAPEPEDRGQHPHLRLGPALVRYGTFWADAENPHFWLKVVMPPMANLTQGKPASLYIKNVLDKAGKNVHDRDSFFEEGMFVQLDFQEQGFEMRRLEAIRDVHLLPGATETDLASVTGELVFELPLNICRLSLSPSGAAEENAHGFTARLKKIEGNEVSMVLIGNSDNHIATVAYDTGDNRMDPHSSSWSNVDDTTTINYGFPDEPVRVEVMVAADRLIKTYPFTLDVE
ncbi:MAG: hypothetical protein SWH61_14740 [Thermodesulfobacteriota bacterium]|nr:hypothetical protein [Thermodesulfobacteriota bacterium]